MRRGTGLKGLAKSIAVLVGLWVTVGVVGAYAGIEPFVSYGEVVKGQAVWLTSQHMQSDEPAYPRARQFFWTLHNVCAFAERGIEAGASGGHAGRATQHPVSQQRS